MWKVTEHTNCQKEIGEGSKSRRVSRKILDSALSRGEESVERRTTPCIVRTSYKGQRHSYIEHETRVTRKSSEDVYEHPTHQKLVQCKGQCHPSTKVHKKKKCRSQSVFFFPFLHGFRISKTEKTRVINNNEKSKLREQ